MKYGIVLSTESRSAQMRTPSYVVRFGMTGLLQAVNSWVQAFAFDASNQHNDDGGGVGGVDSDGGGFLSEGDGDGEDPEDMAALQMECTVHEVLLKNQVYMEKTSRM